MHTFRKLFFVLGLFLSNSALSLGPTNIYEGLDDAVKGVHLPLTPSLRFAGEDQLLTILRLGAPNEGKSHPDFPVHPKAFTNDRPYAQDAVSYLIQWLFPGRNNQFLTPTSYRGDIIIDFSFEQLGKLVKAILENRNNPQPAPWHKIIGQFFNHTVTTEQLQIYKQHLNDSAVAQDIDRRLNLVAGDLELVGASEDLTPESPINDWFENAPNMKSLFDFVDFEKLDLYDQLRNKQKTTDSFDEHYRSALMGDLLTRALNDSSAPWPQEIPELALTQYAWMRAKNLKDMSIFYEQLLGTPVSFDKATPYSYGIYRQRKTSLLEKKPVNMDQLSALSQGYRIYEHPLVNLIAYDTATLTPDLLGGTQFKNSSKKTVKNKRFPDCVETSILNLLRQICYVPNDQGILGLDPSVIKNEKIKTYLVKHHTNGTFGTDEARNEWAALLSNVLPQDAYKQHVTLRTPQEDQEIGFELIPGTLKFMDLMRWIFVDPSNKGTTKTTPQTLKNSLTEISQILSQHQGRSVTFTLDDQEENNRPVEFGNEVINPIRVTFNDPKISNTFSVLWDVHPGHAELYHSPHKEEDWRKTVSLDSINFESIKHRSLMNAPFLTSDTMAGALSVHSHHQRNILTHLDLMDDDLMVDAVKTIYQGPWNREQRNLAHKIIAYVFKDTDLLSEARSEKRRSSMLSLILQLYSEETLPITELNTLLRQAPKILNLTITDGTFSGTFFDYLCRKEPTAFDCSLVSLMEEILVTNISEQHLNQSLDGQHLKRLYLSLENLSAPKKIKIKNKYMQSVSVVDYRPDETHGFYDLMEVTPKAAIAFGVQALITDETSFESFQKFLDLIIYNKQIALCILNFSFTNKTLMEKFKAATDPHMNLSGIFGAEKKLMVSFEVVHSPFTRATNDNLGNINPESDLIKYKNVVLDGHELDMQALDAFIARMTTDTSCTLNVFIENANNNQEQEFEQLKKKYEDKTTLAVDGKLYPTLSINTGAVLVENQSIEQIINRSYPSYFAYFLVDGRLTKESYLIELVKEFFKKYPSKFIVIHGKEFSEIKKSQVMKALEPIIRDLPPNKIYANIY